MSVSFHLSVEWHKIIIFSNDTLNETGIEKLCIATIRSASSFLIYEICLSVCLLPTIGSLTRRCDLIFVKYFHSCSKPEDSQTFRVVFEVVCHLMVPT